MKHIETVSAFSNVISALNRKKIYTSFFILFSLLLIGITAAWGWAEFIVLQPRYFLNQWEQGKQEVTVQQWENVDGRLRLALRLNNSNPEYFHDLGRLYELRANEQQVWTAHAHENREKAINYFREATRLRPVWSMAWIQLGLSKILNQELDDEVILALDNAMKYGPWEFGVQRRIIWLGLSIWEQLPEKTQQNVHYIVAESYKRHRLKKFIKETAKHFKWEDKLRVIVEDMKSKG